MKHLALFYVYTKVYLSNNIEPSSLTVLCIYVSKNISGNNLYLTVYSTHVPKLSFEMGWRTVWFWLFKHQVCREFTQKGRRIWSKLSCWKFFFCFVFAEWKKCCFLLFCVAVRSPYLVTSTPYHPPPRQKRSNANVSFHPKALRSKSTPSIARDRWVTAVKSSGTHFRECCDFVVAAIVTSGQYMYVCLVDWCSLLLVTT